MNDGTIFNVFGVKATIILFVYRAVNGFVILVRLIPLLEWEGLARIRH